jgi:hypothetical protein
MAVEVEGEVEGKLSFLWSFCPERWDLRGGLHSLVYFTVLRNHGESIFSISMML